MQKQLKHFLSAPIKEVLELKRFLSQNFPVSSFKDKVQLQLSKGQIVQLSSAGIENIYVLKELSGVKELDLSDNNIADASPLLNVQIQTLNLMRNKIRQIEDLGRSIQVLNIAHNRIENIDVLNEFSKLQELNISTNPILSIECLQNLKQLKKLLIHNCKVDLNALQNLINLTELGIDNTKTKSIDFIKNLTKLKVLSANKNKIIDASAISNCKMLQELDIRNNNISSISFASSLSDLKKFNAMYNQIQDISPLEDLQYLSELFLGFNQIYDISSLTEMKSVDELGLENNRITDLPEFPEDFESEYTLRLVDISNNYIANAESFAGLQLGQLLISNNYLTEIESLECFEYIRELDVSNNMIKNARKYNPMSIDLHEFTHSPQRKSSVALTKIRNNIRKMNVLSSVKRKFESNQRMTQLKQQFQNKINLKLGTELRKLNQIAEMFIEAFGL
ncbi:Conserved_hypothetical protein [Hexamita inflata]|uniref:Uncharacterized protein n=1 Tax=Hexamita inflata TaxID=28002 RepID=A0AA86QIP5_9EUKA|nr:Conserved hypothetical protein [Hexamita inflata]